MKNDLGSLNNYLFEELERLNDDEMLSNEDNLEKELKRSEAITKISGQIVQNAKVLLSAKIHYDQFGENLDQFYSTEQTKKIENNPYQDFAKEHFKEEMKRRLDA